MNNPIMRYFTRISAIMTPELIFKVTRRTVNKETVDEQVLLFMHDLSKKALAIISTTLFTAIQNFTCCGCRRLPRGSAHMFSWHLVMLNACQCHNTLHGIETLKDMLLFHLYSIVQLMLCRLGYFEMHLNIVHT